MSEAGQAPSIQTDARSRAGVFPPKLSLVPGAVRGVLCGPVSHPGHRERGVTWDKVSSFISHIKIEERKSQEGLGKMTGFLKPMFRLSGSSELGAIGASL